MKLEWVGQDMVSRRLTLGPYLVVSVEAAAASPTFSQRFIARAGKTMAARTHTRQYQLAPYFVVAPCEHEQEGA